MTHSHPLDYALCRAILRTRRLRLGGSDRLGEQGGALSLAAGARRCAAASDRAAGLPDRHRGIESKWPAAIAVGVAAQLLQDISAERRRAPRISARRGRESGCAAGDCASLSRAAASA